ncbi:MAG TPA: amidohydrolase family protein [Streptosporangiaceae bacterium]|nr:amidohydrolase family protein [Streptosporangiaceae bacterium]
MTALAGPADFGGLGDLDALSLVDHHCHGVVTRDLSLREFELLCTEASDPPPAGTTFFDSQLGLSLRRWCPPVLGLAPYADPAEYVRRRRELGAAEVNGRLLRAAAVGDFLVDTGYQPAELSTPAALAAAAAARAHVVVRLEQVAEELAAGGAGAREFVTGYPAALAAAASAAVAVKSIVAYRYGLDFDPARPRDAEVSRAADGWLRAAADPATAADPVTAADRATAEGRAVAARYRIASPVLLRFLLWSAIDLGLPVQVHTGFGDRDLDLHRCNPLLMTNFIRATATAGVPLMLLHCYPYHREAGYLAQIYPHVYCDVGLALNFVGARARAVLAESLELTPFGKTLYSSDAFGLAELHYLGAVGFRRALRQVLGDWLRGEMLTAADAGRIAWLIGAGNARRVYRLTD